MFKPSLLAVATAIVALLGSSAARAQEATPAPEITNFASTRTRAEVIAETRDAMRRGLIARNDADIQRLAALDVHSTKSRAEVRAETLVAMHFGLARYGEAGAPQATPEQLAQIRAAGQRALERSAQLARQ